MAFKNRKNFAISRLAGNVDSVQTTITVKSGEGIEFPDSNFWLVVDEEIMLCSSRTGDILTVQRGQQGSPAASHEADKRCFNAITTEDVGDLQDRVKSRRVQFAFLGTVQINAIFGDGWFPEAESNIKKVTIMLQVAATGNVKIDLLKDGVTQEKETTLLAGDHYVTGDITSLSYQTTERLGLKITQGDDGVGLVVDIEYEFVG